MVVLAKSEVMVPAASGQQGAFFVEILSKIAGRGTLVKWNLCSKDKKFPVYKRIAHQKAGEITTYNKRFL